MPEIRKRAPTDATSEVRIQDEIRLDLGRERDLVLWRLSNGAFYAPAAGGEIGLVRAGIKGAADLIGVLRLEVQIVRIQSSNRGIFVGRFFALEVKAPGKLPRLLNVLRAMAERGAINKAMQHELEQQEWAALVRSQGGFAAFVTSVQGAREALERARTGACE